MCVAVVMRPLNDVQAFSIAQECNHARLLDRLPECTGFIKGKLINVNRSHIEPEDLHIYNK